MQALPEVIAPNTPPSTPKDDDEVCVKASEDDEMRLTREHSAPSDGVQEVQPPKRQRVSGVMMLAESGASSAMQDDECVVVGSKLPNEKLEHTSVLA